MMSHDITGSSSPLVSAALPLEAVLTAVHTWLVGGEQISLIPHPLCAGGSWTVTSEESLI